MTNRRQLLGVLAAGSALTSVPALAQETVREEAGQHPRIARAVHEPEDAIRYMEAAPHDFGGFNAHAIADSRAAVGLLRKALAYRAAKDNRCGRGT